MTRKQWWEKPTPLATATGPWSFGSEASRLSSGDRKVEGFIPEELHVKVEELCIRRGITFSDFLTELLNGHIPASD